MLHQDQGDAIPDTGTVFPVLPSTERPQYESAATNSTQSMADDALNYFNLIRLPSP